MDITPEAKAREFTPQETAKILQMQGAFVEMPSLTIDARSKDIASAIVNLKQAD